ncbi:MAG: TIGR00159 family protein [Acidobacteria bacterium]|nr:MAG: TIGR00159 family protein [Acidobacteriota bacterium]
METLKFLLELLKVRTPNFADLMDIIIMWALFYWVLKAIYRTRAMQMAVGLIALFLIQFFATIFNLNVLSKSVGSLFTIIPIVIIVLFQNEIRNALASLGRRSGIEFRGNSQQIGHILDPIFQATLKFSAKKVGALIVFEQRQSMSDLIETGVALDAIPSYELLRNIFDPSSNLHDGASIISEGKIASSGVVLPLTSQQNLPNYFGTRHRAALGVSEEFDCLVLVVSEETGRIRIAKGGEFTPSLEPTEEALKIAFNSLIDKQETESDLTTARRIAQFFSSKKLEATEKEEKDESI